MSRIFISYSHKDEYWKKKLVEHLGVLEKQGELNVWDDRKIAVGDDWFPEIEKAIEKANVAILLITAGFLTSDFILKEEIPRLLERRQNEGLKVMPLIVKPCAWENVKWLNPIQARPKDGRSLYSFKGHKRDSALVSFVKEIVDLLNEGKPDGSNRSQKEVIFKKPKKIETTKLPTISSTLFGRENELGILDNAWEATQTKIFSFIAWGGVGKSALVNAWLNRIGEDNYRGAELVFGWSFYSQGTSDDKQASADGFLNDALNWFGYKGKTLKSQHEKGRTLAELVAKRKTLLILDGLEPLQYPPGEMHGFLKDQAMQALLKGLARSLDGLCIITSRCKPEDLKSTDGKTTITRELENLSQDAGMQVLKSYDIEGPDKELKQTSKEFNGHALALNLVGSYLKTVHDSDIRKKDLIPKLTEDEKHGGHARRVMESYERWFLESNKPELDILNILGLFDRPAVKEAIAALKAKPAIKGLTDRLQGISNPKWKTALQHLRDLHLIADKDKTNPGHIDCHPLIREHFGAKLSKLNPDAWKETHLRLYEFYKNLPENELPDTIEEMEPLFAAVRHGCLGGKWQEAVIVVYWKRIKRETEHYSTVKLGAFGADLACLSNFFESPWDRPASGLSEHDKASVLSWAGFRLRAVGRLHEAVQPMKAGLKMRIKEKKWKNASIAASNLSELLLTLGDVKEAEKYAKQSVEFSDRSKEHFEKESSRSALADAHHKAGRIKDAELLFIEAENMQKQRQPEYPYLYSLQGFQYCDLLILLGKYQKALKRAKATIKIANQNYWLLDIALNNLTIGKALTHQTIQSKSNDFTEAEHFLNQAVDGLRGAGRQDHLPPGLLSRATLHRHQKTFPKTWQDLDEAREIAEYGGMKLHLTDYYLESCRTIKAQIAGENAESSVKKYQIIENSENLSLTKPEMESKFSKHLKTAEKLIHETGYHRRDGELAELKK